MKKPIIGKDVKPKAYPLLVEAVEAGAAYAWRSRIFKYTDTPTDDQAIQTIADAVMLEINERFEVK